MPSTRALALPADAPCATASPSPRAVLPRWRGRPYGRSCGVHAAGVSPLARGRPETHAFFAHPRLFSAKPLQYQVNCLSCLPDAQPRLQRQERPKSGPMLLDHRRSSAWDRTDLKNRNPLEPHPSILRVVSAAMPKSIAAYIRLSQSFLMAPAALTPRGAESTIAEVIAAQAFALVLFRLTTLRQGLGDLAKTFTCPAPEPKRRGRFSLPNSKIPAPSPDLSFGDSLSSHNSAIRLNCIASGRQRASNAIS